MKKAIDAIVSLGFIVLIGLVGLLDMGHTDLAYAATDVNVVISSAIPSRVIVASGTSTGGGATRVDNWDRGVQCTTAYCLQPLRVSICCQNLDSADDAYFGWTASVSTDTAQSATSSLEAGWKVATGDVICKDADRGLALWAKAADSAGAAGVLLSCEQLGKKTP